MAFRRPHLPQNRSSQATRNRGKERANFRYSRRRATPARPSASSSSTSLSTPVPANYGPSRRKSNQQSHQGISSERSRTNLESEPPNIGQPLPSDDDIDDALSEIIMAVSYGPKDSIGCAYYVAQEEKLYFMEDIEHGDFEIVDALKLYTSPTTIILPVNTDDELVDLLNPEASGPSLENLSSDGFFNQPYTLEISPPSAFKYESAVQKLLNLRLMRLGQDTLAFSVPGDLQTHESAQVEDEDVNNGLQAQLLQISSLISLESRLTIGCAGAVITYLQKCRVSRFLPNDGDADMFFQVRLLEMFSTRGTMSVSPKALEFLADIRRRFINRDALLSLQIFQSEARPQYHNQGPTGTTSGSKGGLSVYGLFQPLARSPQGKEKLRQWLLRPSLSLEIINERLNSLAVFVLPENAFQFDDLVSSMKRIGNMRKAFASLKKGISGGLKTPRNLGRRVWSGLREFAYQATCLEKTLEDTTDVRSLAIYAEIKNKFNTNQLAYVGQLIHNTIDFEEPTDPSRIVKSGVDEDLDESRRLYDGVDSLLSEVARDISMEVPEGLPANLNVVYFPQIGFLISMPKDPETGRSLWEGSEQDSWEIVFSSDSSAYYKNDKMRQMDDHIGDMWNDICDKEIEILHNLSQRVLEFEQTFVEASDVCGELDCLLAFAAGAKLYGFRRPRVTAENVVNISQGRHPLQELAVPSFVPNDTFIQGRNDDGSKQTMEQLEVVPSSEPSTLISSPSVLILTGPNFSGKSIYLKQVALIVYLAHLGSFVPADRAEIGLTDKILTRITTRESVSTQASAFAIDLQQMCLALKLATPRSLVIIDEFGKGTNSADGAGLFAGVIEHLLGSEESRANGTCCTPKVLAATHFHELFELDLLTERPGVGFGHFEIKIDDSEASALDSESGRNHVANQVVYLYNYHQGRSNKSYGTYCAALNGIPPEIVARAEHLVELAAKGEDLVSACAVLSPEETEELEVAERIARLFLESDLTGNPRDILDRIFDEVGA